MESFEFAAISQTISSLEGLLGVTSPELSGLRVNARLDQASPVLLERMLTQANLHEVELHATVIQRDGRHLLESWLVGDVWMTEFRRVEPLHNTYTFVFNGGRYCFADTRPICTEFGSHSFSPDLFRALLEEDELPMLQAGDADQDLDFDQFDLVRVQQAAKYVTGQSATWGEGDWNGAPGGSPGEPPPGNGLFDQFDIIAAQQAGIYRMGPYAALYPNAVTVADSEFTTVAPVPEPSAFGLFVVGVIALTPLLRRLR